MSYQALYRKWRPSEFDEVKGQDHIVTTLRNQIKADRIGHAYLFCGTRGTGKTTVAKIFAKAVNCLHPVDGSPCNECEMCKAINAQTSMNVIEIDAASNNGVDNIREIRDEVTYSPTEGKYKVYIIDEVHMLSIGAFNALLKTLEEPPSYVIFILATTEAAKIPITILSRCQRYDFKRITIDTIAGRLTELIGRENLDVEDKAVRYIARAADGSMRDALSLLDQCVAFYLGQRLTYDNVLDVLGAVDTSVFSRLLRCIDAGRFTEAVRLLEEVVIQGRELTQFVTDFIWYLRNLLLVQGSGDLEDILDISSENLAALQEEAQKIDNGRVMRYIRVFSELSGQIRYSSQKRVLIEVALVRLCQPSMEGRDASLENQLAALSERLENLERHMAQGTFMAGSPGSGGVAQDYSLDPSLPDRGIQTEENAGKTLDAAPEDLKAVIGQWGRIISDVPVSMGIMLKNAQVAAGKDNTLVLGFNESMNKAYFDQEEHRAALEKVIESRVGKHVQVVSTLIREQEKQENDFFIPSKVNLSGVDFTFEDE
ncbi:DNA polymerase-3 subunit gamma/tau [Catenibacillus scindens]|uniref:DNA-directed DNA polymerase n=1 Tax=Catenibacillus scindens TaxID=673271 RepID=A0A7W8HDR8_9FIRM|nr:DNA polymerase III subunit gamma/tau [Catenibacillus scindens]MBB5266088.1 DNA polymerase-3 subunit gamma/tau [Catenibacillus scindens]